MQDAASRSILSQFFTQVPMLPAACLTLAFLTSFSNSVDLGILSSEQEVNVGLDFQVGVKLMLSAAVSAIGVIGLLMHRRVQQALLGIPGIVLVAITCVFLGTSLLAYPEAATISRAASLIFGAYVCFVPTAVLLVGMRGYLAAVMSGLALHMMISWVLYLFFPSIGVFEEELAEATLVHRMGGLAHPNTIGRIAALSFVLSIAMLRSRELAPKLPAARTYLMWVAILAVATLVASLSRTSIVAAVAATGLLWIDRVWTRSGLAWCILAASLAGVALLGIELTGDGGVIAKTILSGATKTGDVQELTSVTGRTDIWAEAIRLIAQRPWTGWGLNSAPFVLTEFSQHTHNAVLHATFSGGLVAGFLVVLLLGWNLFVGLRDSEPIIRAISAFILVSSLVEDTVIDTFPFPATTLWIFAMLYPSLLASGRNLDPGSASTSALTDPGGL